VPATEARSRSPVGARADRGARAPPCWAAVRARLPRPPPRPRRRPPPGARAGQFGGGAWWGKGAGESALVAPPCAARRHCHARGAAARATPTANTNDPVRLVRVCDRQRRRRVHGHRDADVRRRGVRFLDPVRDCRVLIGEPVSAVAARKVKYRAPPGVIKLVML